MGAWSVSVTGNDMARDLKMDYSCWITHAPSIAGEKAPQTR